MYNNKSNASNEEEVSLSQRERETLHVRYIDHIVACTSNDSTLFVNMKCGETWKQPICVNDSVRTYPIWFIWLSFWHTQLFYAVPSYNRDIGGATLGVSVLTVFFANVRTICCMYINQAMRLCSYVSCCTQPMWLCFKRWEEKWCEMI